MPSDIELERRALTLFQRALDVPVDELPGWIDAETAGNDALKSRLLAMLDADRVAALQTGGAIEGVEDESLPERIGAYRITRLIGRGGMGAVYRGERITGDFDHVAAIKLIKPGLLSEKLVDRFQRERQTLASLDHPFIARLYDGGETAEGSPFIVMEHIDGEPIVDWADARQLRRDERLRLFGNVCEAVAHAHRNLIVHRDITPSNVLVTHDGVVKLIDFGIAKPAADGTTMEPGRGSIASLSLTPGFAAPERMTSGEATTASDVYSLGKLLEALMEPCGPDREVMAIATRASATDPAERYPTADALRNDVEAARAHLPVTAMGRSRSYLTRKFIERHRVGVIAASLALLLLIGAFGLTLAANVRAEAARAQAEQRFEETRSIAKALLFDVYSEVSKTPGGTKAREMLARTGLQYLDALAADRNAPLDVRLEAILGYVRLSQVVGGGQASQLGKLADGDALLAKAEGILKTIPDRERGTKPVARAIAEILIQKAGNDLYSNNDSKRARAEAIEAERVLEPYAREDEDSARLYATAVQAEGDSHGWDDNFAKARPVHQRAEAFIAGLPPKMRDSIGVMKARSANMRLLGEAHHKLKDEAAAIEAVDRAVAMNEALLKAVPDDPSILRKVAASLWYRAVLHRENRRDALAAASINRAVALARTMQARDPNDKGALNMFTTTAEVQAQVLADAGKLQESYAVSDDVIAAHHRLVELAGSAPGALRSMATAYDTRAANFYNGRDHARACEAWGQALEIYRGLEKRGVLSDFDRKNGLVQIPDKIAHACNPPRAGIDGRI